MGGGLLLWVYLQMYYFLLVICTAKHCINIISYSYHIFMHQLLITHYMYTDVLLQPDVLKTNITEKNCCLNIYDEKYIFNYI